MAPNFMAISLRAGFYMALFESYMGAFFYTEKCYSIIFTVCHKYLAQQSINILPVILRWAY